MDTADSFSTKVGLERLIGEKSKAGDRDGATGWQCSAALSTKAQGPSEGTFGVLELQRAGTTLYPAVLGDVSGTQGGD